ncbi:MAG: efflux RND transporter permease subunit, partial [Desulfobacterales bacterium]
MKSAVAWFADNPVAANLLMVFLLAAGVVVGLTSKVEIFPETSLDIIRITTSYPGASPAEVEEAVVRRIEEQIAGLAGIDRMDSTSQEGSGTISIEVMTGWDLQSLLDDVKAEVDRITTLPDEAEKPLVREITRRSDVLDLAIYGDAPEATIKYLAEKIKDDITNLPGVTLADMEGVRESEIHIEVSEITLRRYGLTFGQVADAVRQGSLDLPAGSIKADDGEILIRTKGRRYFGREYGDIAIVTRPDGTKLRLSDIADLRDGYEDIDWFARFQGKPAAIINVYRVADQNALKVASAVKEYVKAIQPTLPAGIGIDLRRDRSEILKSRMELLVKNLVFGLVLVVLMLALFLDLRLALWVTLGIPISFAVGFLFLPQFDVSINMISLFAFIMVLGIVVDDAIIVGENVYRHYEEGKPALAGAVEGTLEVGRPVVFSVLTTIVAFWPLLMAGGTMGKLMRNIPIVVILVLIGSLVESLFILPSHLTHSKKAARRNPLGGGKEKITSRWLKDVINGPYSRLVAFCIRWRYATVAAGLSMILITVGLWSGGWMKFTFFPKIEGDTLRCTLVMPVGTPVAQTQAVVDRLMRAGEAAIAEAEEGRPPGSPPLLEYTMSVIGRGSHEASIRIQLLDGEEREISALTLNGLWRKHAGPVPEAESISFRGTIHSTGNPVEVHLTNDDNDQLMAAAERLKEKLSQIDGVFDIDDSYIPGKKEMQLKLKPAASLLGVTLNDLARQVRYAFYGAEALRLQRDQDEVKVKVRYPDDERRSLSDIESMYIRTPDGEEIPFGQVAEVRMDEGYA